jgi:hypothetical protein
MTLICSILTAEHPLTQDKHTKCKAQDCQDAKQEGMKTLVASTPPMTGMAISINSTSNCRTPSCPTRRFTASTASCPFDTTSTVMPKLDSIILATLWLIRLSSASKTIRPYKAAHLIRNRCFMHNKRPGQVAVLCLLKPSRSELHALCI